MTPRQKPPVTGTTHTLNFAALGPDEFERMCVWLLEEEGFQDVEHLGAAGGEQGRDIVAYRDGKLWAFEWQWSSLGRPPREDPAFPILAAWPLPRPANWLELVNQPQSEAELAALRRCVNRGTPYGNADWLAQTAKQLGIESTLRPRGHPRNGP